MGLKRSNTSFGWFILLLVWVLLPVFTGYGQVKLTFKQSVNLPDEVNEISGIIVFNNLIWTFNDSGGEPELYALGDTGKIIRKRVTLWNGTNFDWEEIAQDSNYIYVGDFGNNYGNRDNLCIYRIGKKAITKTGDQLTGAEKIHFTYPNYSPAFILKFNKSAYDCEAMVCTNDSIYLFSKNWITLHSTIYVLPNKPGKYIARKVGEFNAGILVTSASYNGKDLVLLGYNNYRTYIWWFASLKSFELQENMGVKSEIPELIGAQTEGISFFNNNTIYITSEGNSFPQRLWIFNYK